MRSFKCYLILLLSLFASISIPPVSLAQLALNTKLENATKRSDLKGWDHLHSLLVENGVDSELATKLISDPRMPHNEIVYFKLAPKERHSMYRKHDSAKNRRNALRFYKEHRQSFQEASRQFGVNSEVILAILQVETNCGGYTGKEKVFYRLARLSAVANPESIIANLRKIKKQEAPKAHYRDVLARAKWLEGEFLPHLIKTIELARMLGKSPHEIKGSGAGALGLFQFLPGNVLKYGIDGNHDGRIDPYDPSDAIPSVANYLAQNGWNKNKPLISQSSRKVIWHYNRSDSYITTVLSMAGKLKPQLG